MWYERPEIVHLRIFLICAFVCLFLGVSLPADSWWLHCTPRIHRIPGRRAGVGRWWRTAAGRRAGRGWAWPLGSAPPGVDPLDGSAADAASPAWWPTGTGSWSGEQRCVFSEGRREKGRILEARVSDCLFCNEEVWGLTYCYASHCGSIYDPLQSPGIS